MKNVSIREEVTRVVRLGPLPDSDSAQLETVKDLQEAIEKITPPLTREEAKLLMTAFGPDECFGLAWALVHLIESAPEDVVTEEEPKPDANEWVRTLWDRAQRAREARGSRA